MERKPEYVMVKHNGQRGWKLPYRYSALPNSGRVVAVDPAGVTHLVDRKSLTLN